MHAAHRISLPGGRRRRTLRAGVAGHKPRAVVGVLHGIFEHSGRHTFLAEGLAARGYTVHAFDCRGHGRSGGRRASLRRYEQYLDDLDAFVQRLRREEPAVPLFLFGHSLGGQTVLLWAMLRQPADLAGMILGAR